MLDGREVDHAVRDDDIEACVSERQLVDARLVERGLTEPVPLGKATGLRDLLVREIDTDDAAGPSDLDRCTERIRPGARAEI